jgi:hypothetical protein
MNTQPVLLCRYEKQVMFYLPPGYSTGYGLLNEPRFRRCTLDHIPQGEWHALECHRLTDVELVGPYAAALKAAINKGLVDKRIADERRHEGGGT